MRNKARYFVEKTMFRKYLFSIWHDDELGKAIPVQSARKFSVQEKERVSTFCLISYVSQNKQSSNTHFVPAVLGTVSPKSPKMIRPMDMATKDNPKVWLQFRA
jgi:hypothetical protein